TFHPAFRFAGPSRREVGVPTVFNLLGPMANPGRVRHQVIGVANPAFAERMLTTLRHHGTTRAWVVHGNGLDELTTTAPSTVLALEDGEVRTFEVDPVRLGFAPAAMGQLVGGNRAHNASVVRRVMAGDRGPHRDIVVLNAAAGLVVAGAAAGLDEGVALAAASIDEGRAAAALDALVATSQAAAAPATTAS
ncbi:MAG TPA: anthranilate phosphoribosyltransferase, partial [Ilumatobacteraceae bacterium]